MDIFEAIFTRRSIRKFTAVSPLRQDVTSGGVLYHCLWR